MKLAFCFIQFTLLLVWLYAPLVSASDVFILVSQENSKDCFPMKDGSELNYKMTPQEMNQILEKYFSNQKNEKLYDAAIVNAGLKFCSVAEARTVFSFILESFNRPKINRRQLEVGSNYFYTKTFQQEFSVAMNAKSLSREQKENFIQLKAFSKKAWGR